MYDLLERLAPGQRKLELFGRPHNIHKGWTTLGNQLGKSQITEPWLRQRLLDEGIFVEDDMTALPPPPADPIVPPWRPLAAAAASRPRRQRRREYVRCT